MRRWQGRHRQRRAPWDWYSCDRRHGPRQWHGGIHLLRRRSWWRGRAPALGPQATKGRSKHAAGGSLPNEGLWHRLVPQVPCRDVGHHLARAPRSAVELLGFTHMDREGVRPGALLHDPAVHPAAHVQPADDLDEHSVPGVHRRRLRAGLAKPPIGRVARPALQNEGTRPYCLGALEAHPALGGSLHEARPRVALRTQPALHHQQEAAKVTDVAECGVQHPVPRGHAQPQLVQLARRAEEFAHLCCQPHVQHRVVRKQFAIGSS